MSGACQCGAPLARPTHLACPACFDSLPEDLRDRFMEAARTKRGSNTYWSLSRAIKRALAKPVVSGVPSCH